ncbi:MAG: SDR family oxidoreductase [Phycisphaeraceae bacterium]
MKSAIVTGAGSGIGRETARLLAQENYAVVLVGRTEETLRETAELIRGESPEAKTTPMSADVADPEAVATLVRGAIEEHGRIDALCNVAGCAPLNPLTQNTYENWRACIDINLTAIVMLTREVFPLMQQRGGGTIVNVSSMSSFDPFPGFSMYASAKAAVNMFTRCTADEGKQHNIHAVGVAPGAVETGMLRKLFPKDMLPESSTLDPADVARVVVDCATGKRDYTPGETIPMPSG